MGSKLTASVNSPRAEYDVKQYIDPFLSVPNGFRINRDFGPLKLDTLFTAHRRIIHNGKFCLDLSTENLGIILPISAVHKNRDGKKTNYGISYEATCVGNLITCGLMQGEAAGCSSRPDCNFIHFDGESYNGELKLSQRAVVGQTVLHHSQEWGISSKGEAKFPLFSACIKNATVDGKPFLNVVNEVAGRPTGGKVLTEDVYSDLLGIEPLLAFQSDKANHIMHFEDMGTFSVSPLISWLPNPSGTMFLRARNKHPGTITIQAHIKTMEKSSVKFDMKTKEGVEYVKRTYFGYPSSEGYPACYKPAEMGDDGHPGIRNSCDEGHREN